MSQSDTRTERLLIFEVYIPIYPPSLRPCWQYFIYRRQSVNAAAIVNTDDKQVQRATEAPSSNISILTPSKPDHLRQLRYLFICTYLSSSSGSSQHRTAQRAQLSWLTSNLNETSTASVITSSLAVSGVARNLIGGGYTFQLQSLQFQNLC